MSPYSWISWAQPCKVLLASVLLSSWCFLSTIFVGNNKDVCLGLKFNLQWRDLSGQVFRHGERSYLKNEVSFYSKLLLTTDLQEMTLLAPVTLTAIMDVSGFIAFAKGTSGPQCSLLVPFLISWLFSVSEQFTFMIMSQRQFCFTKRKHRISF